MYNNNKILVSVCARGGSKGVKSKNSRPLCGIPMIYYSLDLIKECKLFDDYIISTDSDEIIKLVKDYNFEIKFKRPDYLADDKTSRLDAIKHAVQWLEENESKKYDIIVDLGVATPLKNKEDVENSIKLLIDTSSSNILSVTPSSRNPYYNMIEVFNDKVKIVKSLEKEITDRRDAPRVFDMNDGINVWRRDVLFSDSPMLNDKTRIYEMPKERSVDIDEEFDFLLAEFILKRK